MLKDVNRNECREHKRGAGKIRLQIEAKIYLNPLREQKSNEVPMPRRRLCALRTLPVYLTLARP
jgi:hypothetical protein